MQREREAEEWSIRQTETSFEKRHSVIDRVMACLQDVMCSVGIGAEALWLRAAFPILPAAP